MRSNTIEVNPAIDTTALVGRTFRVRWLSRGDWYSGQLTIDTALHSPTGKWLSVLGRLVSDHRPWKVENTAMALGYGEAELTPQ